MPGTWIHLTARFFDVVAAKPLTDSEVAEVQSWISPDEMVLFATQDHADQRHGYECGRDVHAAVPDRAELVRAAVLHDIGKRHARLGAVGRVFASIGIRLHLPLAGRFAMYARHGELAAEELAELGSPELVVTFARHHHGSRPGPFPPEDWEILEQADRARLPETKSGSGYPVGHSPS
jgi:putative nucleotidyltransferase with HDIG domain